MQEYSFGERAVSAAVDGEITSFEDLAEAMGREPGDDFESEMLDAAPEIESVLEANRMSGLSAVEADRHAMREHRMEAIRATDSCLSQGVSFKRKLKKGEGDMKGKMVKEEHKAELKELDGAKRGVADAETYLSESRVRLKGAERALAAARKRLKDAEMLVYTSAKKVEKAPVAGSKPAMKVTKQPEKAAAKKPEPATKAAKQPAKAAAALDPKDVKELGLEGDAVQGAVVGVERDTYCGRKIVVIGTAGLFGCPPARSQSMCTVNKGIVNHCDISDPKPKASWACIDAASQLKAGFTKAQLLDLAVDTMVRHGGADRSEGDKARTACSNVFDDMKSHQQHARRKVAGWSFIIDSCEGGRMSIRARHSDETLQYFEKAKARANDASFKAVVQLAKKVKVQKPTERKPVSVMVGAAR